MIRKRGNVHYCTIARTFAGFSPAFLYAVILILLWVESSGALGGTVTRDSHQEGMGQHLSKDTGDINMENGNFPSTLQEFGYEIKEGKLRNIRTGGKFVFDVKKGNRRYNQKHYEAIGEIITQEVYKMLEENAGLLKVTIPVKEEMAEEKEESDVKRAESFIFMSENIESYKKLMILIHGTGVVRAGQWARSLIINDCMESGTQLPYIKRAKEEGYGVVVLNTNQNTDINGGDDYVKGSETPEDHFVYVWDHFIKNLPVEDIVIVAHSYGGVVTLEGVKCRGEMMNKVKAIAFTDGVHSLFHQAGKNNKVVEWFRKHSVNWVSSNQPLNHKLKSINGSEPKYSAGTMRHEETSWTSMEPIFQYFRETLETRKESEVREWISNGFPLAGQASGTVESSETGNKKEKVPSEGVEKEVVETVSMAENTKKESEREDNKTEEINQDSGSESASKDAAENVQDTEPDSQLKMDVEEKSPSPDTDVEMSTQDVSTKDVIEGDSGMPSPLTDMSSEVPDDSQTMETGTPAQDKDESKDEL